VLIAFDSPAFIDDTFENPSQRVVVKRTLVLAKDIADDELFTFRIEDFPILLALDPSDGQNVFRTLTQQFQEPLVQ
jgi:hypothetical protein